MKNWIEILLRTIGLFFFILFAIRIMGKRQISKIMPFHFVSYSVIAILTALISINIVKNLAFGFISLVIWIIFPIVLDYLSMKSKFIHDLINGKEIILIQHGKVLEENLKKMRLTGEELLQELRTKNAFKLADVEFAVMETSGELSVLLKADKTPLTPYDLGEKVAPQTAPQTVILDGNILDESLFNIGFNREWLEIQIEKLGVQLENIFIGQVDASGDLYIDLFDDSIQIPKPTVKEMLYANIEKSQADLLTYAMQTDNPNAKKMYEHNAQILNQLLERLKPYLLK